MTLVGVRATHAWLDARMRIIGYAHARNDDTWRDARVLLGAAVHEIVQHLQLNPPQILEITDAGLQRIQHTLGGQPSQAPANPPQHIGASISTDAPPNYESLLDAPDIDMPTIPANYPELDALRRDELQLLLDDEIDFLQFIAKLDVHAQFLQMGRSILDENVKLAEANLQKQDELKILHQQVTHLQAELKDKLDVYKALEDEQNSLCAPPDTREIIRELTKAKKAAMDDSDDYAEQFVENGGNVADFVKEFLSKRRHYHARSAKIELLQTPKTL
jgi:ESCRT-I complex subunit VPS37